MDLTTIERVLLDENKEAEGHIYFDLGGFQARLPLTCYGIQLRTQLNASKDSDKAKVHSVDQLAWGAGISRSQILGIYR